MEDIVTSVSVNIVKFKNADRHDIYQNYAHKKLWLSCKKILWLNDYKLIKVFPKNDQQWK